MKHISLLGIGSLCVAGGFALGWLLHTPSATGPLSLRQSDLASSTYKFIDPLLAVRNPDAGNSPEYNDLYNKTGTLVADAHNKKIIQTASVYFRELGPSKGFVINGTEQYSPASLLKVPTMMSYYKLSESYPGALDSQATYTGAHNANGQEHIKSSLSLAPGTYRVQTLMEYMIRYSDNNAAETLIANLPSVGGTRTFGTLFSDLGISTIDLTNDFITVRAYALFFRVLYNATYLSREDSEAALHLLSESDFNDGLRAGVPSSVVMAHKFGEFSLESSQGQLLKRELHDCGIIYYPQHNYLLCVMTKGDDFLSLESTIAGISAAAYEFMASKYPF